MSSSRERVVELITPMLPAEWHKNIVWHTVKNIEGLSVPSVFMDFTAMSHAGMPEGAMVDEFEIALISHLTDYTKAEDLLDPAVRALVRGLDASRQIAWTRSDKRNISGYLAWVVAVQLPVNAHQE